jgi:hypothetical protein
MRAFLALLVLCAGAAHAQVYRWVDGNGTVNYSNEPPPSGVAATQVPIEAKAGAPSPDTQDCYSVRCQGERMEERIARRDQADARARRERAALAPPQPRGLEFRKYISIQTGMTEGEVLSIAGRPDLRYRDRSFRTWTYLPVTGEPWTTTITFLNGRVHELDRQRKF